MLSKFRVYQLALEFATEATKLSRQARRKRRLNLADQLLRAAESIVLNIGEGAGEFSPGDKVRFYRMALRSATECEAALALIRTQDLARPADVDRASALLNQVISILTRLCQS